MRDEAFRVHPEVRVAGVETVSLRDGQALVGAGLRKAFAHMEPGDRLTIGKRAFVVNGIIDTGGTTYDSEIWIAADEMWSLLPWRGYSSVRMTAAPGADRDRLQSAILADPKLTLLKTIPERDYYGGQFRDALQIRQLIVAGALLSALAAALAAMLAMFTAVARRSHEIGVMRAIGYAPRAILLSFLVEAAVLGAAAALIALPVAAQLGHISYTTGAEFSLNNLSTRAVVMHFRSSRALLAGGSLLGIALALLGGLPPARQAATVSVVSALRKH